MAPEHWQLRPVRAMILSIVAVLAGAGFLWWAYCEWLQHRLGVGVALGGWGLAIVGGAAMGFLINAGVLHGAVTGDGSGTVLSPSRTLDVIARVLCVVVAISGVVGLVVWWRGGTEMAEFSAREQGRWVMASALLGAVGAVTSPRWFSRRGPLGYLRLSPSGVEYIQGMRTVQLPWQDIVEITDESPSKRKMPCPITFRLPSGELKVFAPGAFGRDPAQIYWMIQHYWHHPDRRVELADNQAEQRLHRSDFSGFEPQRDRGRR